MNFKINGKAFSLTLDEPKLPYEHIAAYVGIDSRHVPTVTYQGPRVGDSQRSGILSPGETLTLEDGMSINCVVTGNA